MFSETKITFSNYVFGPVGSLCPVFHQLACPPCNFKNIFLENENWFPFELKSDFPEKEGGAVRQEGDGTSPPPNGSNWILPPTTQAK